jgi:hypothetical protein
VSEDEDESWKSVWLDLWDVAGDVSLVRKEAVYFIRIREDENTSFPWCVEIWLRNGKTVTDRYSSKVSAKAVLARLLAQ